MKSIDGRTPNVNILTVGLTCSYIFKQPDYYDRVAPLYQVYQPSVNLYKDSKESFIAFISQSILKESLRLDKSILSFESYFYKTCESFFKEINSPANIKLIAKAWLKIEQVYGKLKDFVKSDEAIEVTYLDKYFLKHPHTNYTVNPFSYHIDSLITIKDKDGYITLIEVFPTSLQVTDLYSLAAVNYFGKKLKTIACICFNSEDLFSFIHMQLQDTFKLVQLYKSLHVDFDKPSLVHCRNCIVKDDCKTVHKLTSFTKTQISPYQFNKRY